MKNHQDLSRGPSKLGFIFPVFIILILVAIGGGIAARHRIFGEAPKLALVDNDGKSLAENTLAIGKIAPFSLSVTAEKTSVCSVNGTLSQKSGADQKDFTLFAYTPENGKSGLANILLKPTQSDLAAAGLTEGEATVTITAKDCAFFAKESSLSLKLSIDLAPPQVSITSSQHYINQGGADLVTYQVSPDATESGVLLGGRSFTGHVVPGTDPKVGQRFAFLVWSYELGADAKAEVFARDAAGNEASTALLPSKFFPKEFRHRDLPIDDNFIQNKVSAIITNTPGLKNQGDNLKNFLLVNRELRKTDNTFLLELSKKSAEKFYWKDAFRPLTNAAVEASFADYRSYIYNNQKVDEQVHLGFDLAVVEHNPILAAGDGSILFVGYLGIYGNVVIIDHGYGLMTLYAHLSSMDVQVGDFVKRDQKIANSGATGLAGGDHLHFSMLIDGVQTNPVEFWDQHWIQDHVYLRIDQKFFGQN